MKITIEDRLDGQEDEIIIRCKQMDEHLLKLVYAIKAGREKLTATKGTDIVQVAPKDIFYFEAVDNKVFLYLEQEVYETKLKLYELEEMLKVAPDANCGFCIGCFTGSYPVDITKANEVDKFNEKISII